MGAISGAGSNCGGVPSSAASACCCSMPWRHVVRGGGRRAHMADSVATGRVRCRGSFGLLKPGRDDSLPNTACRILPVQEPAALRQAVLEPRCYRRRHRARLARADAKRLAARSVMSYRGVVRDEPQVWEYFPFRRHLSRNWHACLISAAGQPSAQPAAGIENPAGNPMDLRLRRNAVWNAPGLVGAGQRCHESMAAPGAGSVGAT